MGKCLLYRVIACCLTCMCSLYVHVSVLFVYPNSRLYYYYYYSLVLGRDSISRYSNSQRSVQSRDRISVGARFFAPVQTGPAAHPVSYTVGTGSFPVLKRPVHCVEQPPVSNAEVKERVGLYTYSPSGPSWPAQGFTLLCLLLNIASVVGIFLVALWPLVSSAEWCSIIVVSRCCVAAWHTCNSASVLIEGTYLLTYLLTYSME
jgi:hypothetical protein